jgi:hypothetical protein
LHHRLRDFAALDLGVEFQRRERPVEGIDPDLEFPPLPSTRPSSQNARALPITPSRSSITLRLRKWVPGTTWMVFGKGSMRSG